MDSEGVGDDPRHVGEVLLARDRRRERALGERSVADVAALGTAHEPGLPDREGREVVVVPEGLGLLEPEVVHLHVHPGRAERDAGKDLSLTAGEQRRAVHSGSDVYLRLDRADFVLRATVGALLVDGDPLPDHVFFELRERRRDLGGTLRVGTVAVLGRGVLLEHSLLDGIDRVLARKLLGDLGRLVELAAVGPANRLDQVGIDNGLLDLELLLAGGFTQLLDRADDLLDLVVGDIEGIENLLLGDAGGAALDHQDRVLRAGDDQVHLQVLATVLRRVDDEVAVELPYPYRADVLCHRDIGNCEGCRSPVHGKDVVRMDAVHGHRLRDELRLLVPALGEERPQWAIDHPRGQRRLLTGARFAAEE